MTVILIGFAATSALVRPLVVVLPTVVVFWALIVLDAGYQAGRGHRHRRRRRQSSEARSDRRPGAGTRRPQDYPGILTFGPELGRAVGDPVDHQGRLRAQGIRLAALPLVAATMFAAQTVLLPGGGMPGIGFAAAACAALLIMLSMIWSGWRPTSAWVTSRLRRELFRREMYLLLARTGPYLDTADSSVRDARVNLLVHADADRLHDLVPLSDQDARAIERPWIDQVWQAPPKPVDPDGAERMRTYLEYRIGRQLLYFKLGAEKHEQTEQILGTAAKVTVLTGIAVAIMYSTALAVDGTADRQPLTAVLALLAASLPALCNGVLALQNLFASQRLARSYQETVDELLQHENTLHDILTHPTAPDAGTRFQALALHVETTLSRELVRWKALVDRPEFDPAL